MNTSISAALLLAAALLHSTRNASAELGSPSAAPASFPDAPAAEADYDADHWTPAWSDEFDSPGLPEAAKWGYESGFTRNNELQRYSVRRLENAHVEDGKLHLVARPEPWEGAAYSSASLTTKGLFEFTYGKVEILARVPVGRGTWPALWTMGSNIGKVDWPLCGEIDIVEYVGFDPDRVHTTVHTGAFNHRLNTHIGVAVPMKDAAASFHRYGIIWDEDVIHWFVDGRKVHEFRRRPGKKEEEWPFHGPQYLLMSLAVGGNWGGAKGVDPAAFPADFVIDYVRVFKRSPALH